MMAGVVLTSIDEVDAEGEGDSVVATLTFPNTTQTSYTSLNSAITAYNNSNAIGDYVLNILQDVGGVETLNHGYAGKKLTITSKDDVTISTGFTIGKKNTYSSSSMTFQGLLFNPEGEIPIKTVKNSNARNINIISCTFELEDELCAIQLRHTYDVKIIGCTHKGGTEMVHGYNATTNLTISDTTISDCVYGLFVSYPVGNVSIDKCTITADTYGIWLRNGNRGSVSISGSEIIAKQPLDIERWNNYALRVSVSDSKMVSEDPNGWCNIRLKNEGKGTIEIFVIDRSLDPLEITGSEYAVIHDHRSSCDAPRTCSICQESIPQANHEYKTDTSVLCKVHTCIHCSATTTAVPCKYDSTIPLCKVSNCEYCGESRDLADHTPQGPACKATVCDTCGTSIAPIPHDLPYTCRDAECKICHEIITKTGSHDLPSNATCIDRICSDCGTVVRGDGEHDYEITGYKKICSMCGDVVNLPIEGDDDDDWYWWWLQQQAAKQEAERLAQEMAEEEHKKKVAAVAVAAGAAVAMALLMMTTMRKD